MALTLEDLTAISLGRQFPEGIADVAGLVAATGPIQSQTARSPFIGLAARRPGTTLAELAAAYESGAIVRGSTIRGTVHTATPGQYAALGAATRVGQRTLWQRLLRLERGNLDDLWVATEKFADDWRTPAELEQHLHDWLISHEGRNPLPGEAIGRYLTFGHGGLVRRPANGSWAGQGAPVYRSLAPPSPVTPVDAVALHVRCHGPDPGGTDLPRQEVRCDHRPAHPQPEPRTPRDVVARHRIYEYVDGRQTGKWVVIQIIIEWGDGMADRGWLVTAYPVATHTGQVATRYGKSWAPSWLANSFVFGPINNDILY